MADSTATSEITAVQSLRRVLANKGLRRVQLAFFGSVMGDWAYATAVTVWAYTDGGATAVGIFSALRFLTAAVAGPLGALVADRVSRKTFMISTDVIRAVLVAAAAINLGLGGPSIVVYVLATVVVMVGASFRSAQAGLIPKLVSRPEELTSANAVASNLENVGGFAGPALGALLVAVGTVELAFWFNVATFVISALLVAAVAVPPAAQPDRSAGEEPADGDGFLRDVTAGFAVIAKDRDLAVVSGLAAAQGLVWGALTVFLVIVSVSILDAGAAGVGYLNAILGVGTIGGGLVILTRTTKGRLARDMNVGVLGWSIPLMLLAIAPSPVTAILALAVIGLMDPWVNVGLDTIPQRIVPDRVLSRVFAAVEAALDGAVAAGALLAPLLIHWFGFRPSLVLVGAVVTAYALATWPRVRRLDARLAEPAHLALLRSVSLFSPLSPPTLEALAHAASTVSVAAGETVVVEGEAADRFFVIVSGSVEVTQQGSFLRTEAAGEFFGEIGLLRDVPRTATVTATTDVELVALDRAEFLSAVTGLRESRLAAEEIVSRRLGV